MAKLVYGLNQSLDGYVDHEAFAPGPVIFQHFIEQTRATAGSIYGRRMYEIMRYWDEDDADWDDASRAFAEAWRRQPKWVVSRTLASVGPNATLVSDGLEGFLRELKAQKSGSFDVAGPVLAQSLTELGLIDEYQIYLYPLVLGRGKAFFGGPRPPLKFVESKLIGDDVVKLTYVPA